MTLYINSFRPSQIIAQAASLAPPGTPKDALKSWNIASNRSRRLCNRVCDGHEWIRQSWLHIRSADERHGVLLLPSVSALCNLYFDITGLSAFGQNPFERKDQLPTVQPQNIMNCSTLDPRTFCTYYMSLDVKIRHLVQCHRSKQNSSTCQCLRKHLFHIFRYIFFSWPTIYFSIKMQNSGLQNAFTLWNCHFSPLVMGQLKLKQVPGQKAEK